MRIAIDISQVIYGTGVSVYIKNLITNLFKIDKGNDYILFGGSLRRKDELERFVESLQGNFQTKLYPIPPSVFDVSGNIFHYPKIEKFLGRVDVYHSSDWSQLASDAYNITTIHDLAPFLLSRYTDSKIVDVHKRRFKWIAKEVQRIIVPSNATKLDLIKLGIEEKRVVVIPEAVEPIFKKQDDNVVEEVLRKYKIFGKYVLAIGVNFRKNTSRIIEAFSKAKNKNLKLVIVGHKYAKIDSARGVIFTGHVASTDLPALYSGAEALVYPSLYEGFGLPILEAFVCGCPVVTSNLSSMPEVAGNAAVLVDPYSVDSITEGIKQALRGKIGLSKKGLKQAQKFSWEENAKQTLQVYNSQTSF